MYIAAWDPSVVIAAVALPPDFVPFGAWRSSVIDYVVDFVAASIRTFTCMYLHSQFSIKLEAAASVRAREVAPVNGFSTGSS